MTRRDFATVLIALVSVLGLASVEGQTQSTSGPEAYSLNETNALLGPELTVEIHRDGSRVLVESTGSATADLPKGTHTRVLYDLGSGKSYTLDLINLSEPCKVATFKGDWGDPFARSKEMLADFAKTNPQTLGTDEVAGIRTKLMEAFDPQHKMTARVWLDEEDHLIMKLEGSAPGYPTRTFEVKRLSLDRPPASTFVVPAACEKTN